MLHLLAATDFSEPAGVAVDRAVSLAALNPESSLTLVHVHSALTLDIVRQMLGGDAEEMERALVSDADGRLRSLAAKCAGVLGRSVAVRLARGNPVVEIVEAAAALSAEVVVMGERGGTPARSPFLGGTIERVLQKTKCSVLAVKGPVSGPYRRVVVGVSSWSESKAAAETACRLNPDADIVLLHAFEAPFEEKFRRAGAAEEWIESYRTGRRRSAEAELERLRSELEGEGLRVRRIAVHGSPAPAIVDHAGNLGADLIVVGRSKESGLGGLLFGNVARRVAAEARIDVLVASPGPERAG